MTKNDEDLKAGGPPLKDGPYMSNESNAFQRQK
jgi:hypothetical protein